MNCIDNHKKTYEITLINLKKELKQIITCSKNQSILEAAEANQIELPYSCRAGCCSSCVGKITKGYVSQVDQTFLTPKHLEEGFVLTCVAYPASDLTVYTCEEENLY